VEAWIETCNFGLDEARKGRLPRGGVD